MAKQVYITATNCVSPLGFGIDENIAAILRSESGISRCEDTLMPEPYYAAVVDEEALDMAFKKISAERNFTKLEKMMILALHPVVAGSRTNFGKRTALLLSTTKGNITALNEGNIAKAHLYELAKTVFGFFGFTSTPVVISNACVSGVMAISVARRMILSDMCEEAFIVSGDLVSEFVLSGFNSFQAMSDSPCKPYSKNRTGVTLGEAAAAILVSKNADKAKVAILGDASINDANHISGPSRTGEGLFLSVGNALREAGVLPSQIDHISAHGTATPFNDEMEAIAFNRLGLHHVPLNSLKGYYGHTLGASGLLETVVGIESVLLGKLFASMGYDEPGMSQPLNVIEKNTDKSIRYFLKTASGFGGCNTAVVFEKAG